MTKKKNVRKVPSVSVVLPYVGMYCMYRALFYIVPYYTALYWTVECMYLFYPNPIIITAKLARQQTSIISTMHGIVLYLHLHTTVQYIFIRRFRFSSDMKCFRLTLKYDRQGNGDRPGEAVWEGAGGGGERGREAAACHNDPMLPHHGMYICHIMLN